MATAQLDVTMPGTPSGRSEAAVQSLDVVLEAFVPGPPIRRLVTIDRSSFTIGRGAWNALQVTNSGISRDHAEILTGDGDYVLHDRDSFYGTFVNDQRITDHRLVHGDTIRLGPQRHTTLVLLLDEDPSQIPR
jgi:pSer/pThr/pTyr-binding forkhead associated (FHA) protein